ncbi:hypothetical protein ACLHFD_003385 [Vibrio alginolyticus]
MSKKNKYPVYPSQLKQFKESAKHHSGTEATYPQSFILFASGQ